MSIATQTQFITKSRSNANIEMRQIQHPVSHLLIGHRSLPNQRRWAGHPSTVRDHMVLWWHIWWHKVRHCSRRRLSLPHSPPRNCSGSGGHINYSLFLHFTATQFCIQQSCIIANDPIVQSLHCKTLTVLVIDITMDLLHYDITTTLNVNVNVFLYPPYIFDPAHLSNEFIRRNPSPPLPNWTSAMLFKVPVYRPTLLAQDSNLLNKYANRDHQVQGTLT